MFLDPKKLPSDVKLFVSVYRVLKTFTQFVKCLQHSKNETHFKGTYVAYPEKRVSVAYVG